MRAASVTIMLGMQFDEGSDKYRCCCQCCHVKTGAALVGLVELIIAAILLINSLFLIANTDTKYNIAMFFVVYVEITIAALRGTVEVNSWVELLCEKSGWMMKNRRNCGKKER